MTDTRFWNRIAGRYAARPLDNPQAYEEMLAHLRGLLHPQDRVLEIACGTGMTALRLAPHVGQYVASDFSPGMLGVARGRLAESPDPPANLTLVEARPGNAALGGPFDAVLAFSFLHLVDDLPGTLAAIRGHLRPGGLFLSKTICLGDRSPLLRPLVGAMRMMGKLPRIHFLTADRLAEQIGAAGLVVEDRRTFGAATAPFIAARRP